MKQGGECMLIVHNGMSGTGKTTKLIEMIKNETRPIMYLVPDQMSVHTERFVTSQMKNKATTNVYVYTFKLLEKQILKKSTNQTYRELGTLEQFFLLMRLLEKHRDDLSALRYMSSNSDQMNECLELFSLWRNQCVDTESLLSVTPKGKMYDLLFLYGEFMKMQVDDSYFPEEVYRLASQSLETLPFFENAVVIIDGFYLFSQTEQVMLSHILKQAADIHITFPVYMNGSVPLVIEGQKKIIQQLAVENKHEVKQIEYTELKRYEKTNQIFSLVENLPNTNQPINGEEGLAFFKAATIDEEIHEIASRIRQGVISGNDYSDYALYISDMATYKDKITDLFTLYDIPVFLDSKESIQYTALAQLYLTVVQLFNKKITGESIISLLKMGYFMKLEDVYAIEPVLQLFALNDEKSFSLEKWYLYCEQQKEQEVWRGRFEKFQSIVDQLASRKREFSQKRSFGAKLEILFAFFDDFELFEQLSKIEDPTIVQMFVTRIEELFEMFQNDRITNDLFVEVSQMVIQQLKMTRQPSSQNQVIIADFTRSRISQNMQLSGGIGVKEVFVPGFIQGSIPSQSPSFTLLKADDIQEELFTELLPSQKVEYELRYFYLYLALAQPSERLTLSYSTRSRTNEENHVHRMFELLAKNARQEIVQAVATRAPFAPTHELIEAEAIVFADFLFDKMKFSKTKDEMEELVLQTESGTYSVSQFERYNSCPFQYFVERRLGLREKHIAFTDSRTIGNIVHDFMEQISNTNVELLDEVDPLLLSEQFLQQYEQEKLGFSYKEENAYGQLLRLKLCEHLADNLGRYVTYRKNARFIPFATEAVFQTTVANRNVRGKIDRVDVAHYQNETYFQVIDYKSSDKSFDWSNFVAGTQIQLPFYVYAKDGIQKKFESNAIPFGFYYQTLKVDDDKNPKTSVSLNGYTRAEQELILDLSDDITQYRGMKINKNGSFSQHAKILSDQEIEQLMKKTEEIATNTIERIEANEFTITPLAFEDATGKVSEPSGCDYCRFKALCQRELLTKKDYRKCRTVKKEDVL